MGWDDGIWDGIWDGMGVGILPFPLIWVASIIESNAKCVAAAIRANHPIHSQCRLFYFEVDIIDKGKNGYVRFFFYVIIRIYVLKFTYNFIDVIFSTELLELDFA